MPENKDITCVLCQSEIPPGFTTCPKCGNKVGEVLSARPVSQAPPEIKMGFAASEQLPAASLPEVKNSCPFCAMPFDPSEKKCPRCGAPLHAETAMIECPECGALELIGASACSRCGASLVKKKEIPPAPKPPVPPAPKPEPEIAPVAPVIIAPIEAPKPEPAAEPIAAPQPETVPSAVPEPLPTEKVAPVPVKPETTGVSKTTPAPKGLINGRGIVNGTYHGNVNGTSAGAINGRGMVNGRGAINGTGLVNGTGLTNGAGLSANQPRHSAERARVSMRWKLLVLLVVIVVAAPTALFLVLSDHKSFAIDGNFDDWNGVQKFGMRDIAPLSEIAVYEWAVRTEGTSVSMFLRVQGAIMGATEVDSFFLFIDSDNQDVTGYSLCGIGADYAIEIDGWNAQVQSAALMEFGYTDDNHDWNSWMRTGAVTYASKAGMLEAMGSIGMPPVEGAKYVLLAQNNVLDPAYSISYPVEETGGVLVITQTPGPSISSAGTVPKGPNQALVTLNLKAQGAGGNIASIDPIVSGADIESSITNIDLAAGESRDVDILVDTSASPDSEPLSVILAEYDVASTFDLVIIEGDIVSAYVASPPPQVEIDGAFADWLGLVNADNDTADVPNPDVDLSGLGAASASNLACFYVAVKGTLYQGAFAPSVKTRPTGSGGGGPVIETPVSGEDVLRIFIDSDVSNSTGKVISKPDKTIGADYFIEMKGTDGMITSQSVSRYVSPNWVSITAPISAAKDSQRIELSVPLAAIGASAMFKVIVETTDWHSRGDYGFTGTIPDPWVVDAAGNTYQTTTGGVWAYLGTPTLVPGDYIADIALSSDSSVVFLVTNTGRTFYWEIGISSSWVPGQTRPINTTQYSNAVSMAFYQRNSAWLMTKNGSYFWLMDVTASKKDWTFQDVAAAGYTDFTDLVYAGGTMYALRSSVNSGLLYSGNGNAFQDVTNPTGSSSTQTEFTFLPGGPNRPDDRIFVLCENGDIRYSANGGTAWSSLGNLPRVTGGNTSRYVGLGIDSDGYMWVVTDDGYTFRSTDTATYNSFTYTGRAPIGGIVAVVPLPIIPEFQYVAVPVVLTLLVFSLWRRSARRKIE